MRDLHLKKIAVYGIGLVVASRRPKHKPYFINISEHLVLNLFTAFVVVTLSTT
jgi:hypothetical protein